jgi:bifunctional non-homologous end joining protein LigD
LHVLRLTLAPMLATSATVLPEGPLWTYEVKWDGYRALAMKDGPRVQLLSRNQKDLTSDYPNVVAAGKTVRTNTIVLDGEIVAVEKDGRPSFQALQHLDRRPRHRLVRARAASHRQRAQSTRTPRRRRCVSPKLVHDAR